LDGRQIEIAHVQPQLIINRVDLFPPLGQLGLSLSAQPIQMFLVDGLIHSGLCRSALLILFGSRCACAWTGWWDKG
jgi:hypothetical protein